MGVILASGTLGYVMIEKWGVFDSFYMTVITLTTVGYGEIHQLSEGGRIFTVVLIFLGAGFALYAAGAIVQFMVEGQIRTILGRRILDNKISKVYDHYIVCGYGRIGRVLCHKLVEKSTSIVVIEKNPDLVPVLEKDRALYISGDASDESILLRAGIKRAKGLIAALATDTDNVFLVLTARQLNPDVYILARSSFKESKPKLLAAGANVVESPYDTGGVSMAMRILRPTVTNFLDTAIAGSKKDIQIEEMKVSESSELINIMLKDTGIRQQYELIIIAIKKADGDMIFNPSFETVIKPGDTVIAVGEEKNLLRFEKALCCPDEK